MINTYEAAAVRQSHRMQCFDAIRVALKLDDRGATAQKWNDFIDSCMEGRSCAEVVELAKQAARP